MNIINNSDLKLKGCTILVVEDNELNQQVAQALLEYNGAVVSIASNGQEALDELSKENFDCVLMDVQMPVLDGLEATKMIRANPKWSKISIIALTANADQDYRDSCRSAGMNDFLVKPIDPEQLVIIISKWLLPG
ncbi:CheY chemotaxis protein or a CheY-like REC (receiver) domain [Nitrosomonas ureae]|uniref:CheY chemotaxis protein or a CheY-like REC (Receiver) domain n=1 Tax=Nitrosomonas ureae TaxID=44577 RepID=A0A285BZ15_9PROT|nr:response regulator [Nitrosomonas ureae]SNX60108.1 CheY chemotaxis protein or a CheY-like REC (receiver) domain [Nitrosomonas ureae]